MVYVPLANQNDVLEIDVSKERRLHQNIGLKVIENKKETDPNK